MYRRKEAFATIMYYGVSRILHKSKCQLFVPHFRSLSKFARAHSFIHSFILFSANTFLFCLRRRRIYQIGDRAGGARQSNSSVKPISKLDRSDRSPDPGPAIAHQLFSQCVSSSHQSQTTVSVPPPPAAEEKTEKAVGGGVGKKGRPN